MSGSKVRGGCRFFLKFGGVGFSNGRILFVQIRIRKHISNILKKIFTHTWEPSSMLIRITCEYASAYFFIFALIWIWGVIAFLMMVGCLRLEVACLENIMCCYGVFGCSVSAIFARCFQWCAFHARTSDGLIIFILRSSVVFVGEVSPFYLWNKTSLLVWSNATTQA